MTKYLHDQISRMLAMSVDYEFEDGMITPLHDNVDEIIAIHGACGVDQLYCAAMVCKYPDASNAILRRLGDVDDKGTHDHRRHLLEAALFHPHHYIRDAAGLAIANMDDPASIPAIKSAIEFDNMKLMRSSQQLVLNQLERTQEATVEHLLRGAASGQHD